MRVDESFPPRPRGLRGRAAELRALARVVTREHGQRLALVGGGGSGKSMLACALGHAVAPAFDGRIDWFRTADWDYHTLLEMLALRYGTRRTRERLLADLVRLLRREPRLLVLDNHEDDRAMARLLDAFRETRATFVLTARRCLLAGVLVFPVTAPLATTGGVAFPRVAALTRALRSSPLALDVADAIVSHEDSTVRALARFLEDGGVSRVRVIDHEDDLPEVALLVAWAWERLDEASRAVLAVLAHQQGDHADVASIAALAGIDDARRALEPLRRWRLVQEPVRDRFAVHAVVRYALQKRTTFPPERAFAHYVSLLEREPGRVGLEQTHLFAAMDHANRAGDVSGMLRIERLLARLGEQRG
jgi:hypothetical protein